MNHPTTIESEEQLDETLSCPRESLLDAVRQLQSPVLVFGASGKMGPTLCWLLRRAAELASHPLEIVAVSRFSGEGSREWLESRGIKTIAQDILEPNSLHGVPESANVLYLVGLKFGTGQNPSMTWAVNTLVPARVLERYPQARMVVLSTGNVYGYAPVGVGGAKEDDALAPVGEYGGAALARERIVEYYSRRQGTPVVLLRLNYAAELRYGVLLDLAQKVWNNQPIELGTGFFNCIWQGDANEMILRSFALASAPPAVFNLTGPSMLSVREVAERFGALLQRQVQFEGAEAETALLSNSSRLCARLGPPATSLDQMLQWTARWVSQGGPTLGKPTHFEVRSGKF